VALVFLATMLMCQLVYLMLRIKHNTLIVMMWLLIMMDRTAVVIDVSVDCDRDELSDDVGDDNESDMGTNTHNELLTNDTASCQQIAEEQWSDDALTGCFKLAKAAKGGLELHEGG